MNKLVEEIIKPILESNPKITKVVGIYGGRFQPFGPHHLKTYKWLEKQVDEAYITTSNIKKPPRHPMNYKEKVRHMSKMGVPSSKISLEKSPFVAKNLAKKYDKDTTAFVYVFGKKDAGRLSGGKYFQDYKKNKKNLKGHEEHGYYLVAPHVSIKVAGQEVSGTAMRHLLGSPKIDDDSRVRLFKKMFGYFDKGVFNMLTNKFKKLFKEASTSGNQLYIPPSVVPKQFNSDSNDNTVSKGLKSSSKKSAHGIDSYHMSGSLITKKKKNEDVDMEFKPISMKYVPSKKRKLKKKHKDGKGEELLKGQMEEKLDIKSALKKLKVPSTLSHNKQKLVAYLSTNPQVLTQLLRLMSENTIGG